MKHETSPTDTMRSMVGPPDLWDMKRAFQKRFLLSQGLQPFHRVLDFGCGNLRGGLPLIEYLDSANYTGVEMREEVLQCGVDELRASGLAGKNPTLIRNSDGLLNCPGQTFDFIWAFSVLIHVADESLPRLLRSIAFHMHPHSRFFANVHVGARQSGTWKEFPCVTREWSFYLDAFLSAGLRVEDIGTLMQHGHIHPRLTEVEQSQQRMLRASLA